MAARYELVCYRVRRSNETAVREVKCNKCFPLPQDILQRELKACEYKNTSTENYNTEAWHSKWLFIHFGLNSNGRPAVKLVSWNRPVYSTSRCF